MRIIRSPKKLWGSQHRLKHFVVPPKVRIIPEECFSKCSEFAGAWFADVSRVTELGLPHLVGLVSVVLPFLSVRVIGERCFSG